MVFVQIKNQIIINSIVIDDISLINLFKNDPITGEPYDYVLQVDSIYPQPGIGWSFDGITFTAPPPPPGTPSDEEE